MLIEAMTEDGHETTYKYKLTDGNKSWVINACDPKRISVSSEDGNELYVFPFFKTALNHILNASN